MEIVLGLWAIIYLFVALGLSVIAFIMQFWPGLLAYVLLPGLLLGALMQRLNINNLGAFLAAEGLLFVFDTLFNPSRTFAGLLLNINNFMSIEGLRLIATANLVCVLPFVVAIQLGYVLGRRIRYRRVRAVEP